MDAVALPAVGTTGEITLNGPEGRLEALLSMPSKSPSGIAVVCHPHPLYGGALTNKVVYTLATSAVKCGLPALRFNFRGVGDSQGAYDSAIGETDDALAAIDWMRARFPGLPLLLAGFSFGAYVALKASATARPERLITASLPLGRIREEFGEQRNEPLPSHPGCPWLTVHSRDDDVVAYAETVALLQHYDPPPQLVSLDTAGHFYHRHLGPLQRAVLTFLRQEKTD